MIEFLHREDSLTTSSATLLGLKIVGGKVSQQISFIARLHCIALTALHIWMIVGSLFRQTCILWQQPVTSQVMHHGRYGAVIEKVKKGSVADVMGHLLPGDEVFEADQ